MSHIEIKKLDLVYQGINDSVHAVSDLNLIIPAGEPVALIGPSGCGKSSILKLISGLIKPTSGSVEVDGETISGPRDKTGLILQDYGLLPWKNVLENAALGLRIKGMKRAQAQQAALEALKMVRVDEYAKLFPEELSGGMKQRLALARALALDIDILLMDEPLSALDALTREAMQDELLAHWRSRNYTQVLVTHSIEEAVFLGKTIVVLSPRPGRIVSILKNEHMGSREFRDTPEFFDLSRRLRQLLNQGEGSDA